MIQTPIDHIDEMLKTSAMLTVAQAAEVLGVSSDHVRSLIDARRIGVVDLSIRQRGRGKRMYRTLRIPEAAITDYLTEAYYPPATPSAGETKRSSRRQRTRDYERIV